MSIYGSVLNSCVYISLPSKCSSEQVNWIILVFPKYVARQCVKYQEYLNTLKKKNDLFSSHLVLRRIGVCEYVPSLLVPSLLLLPDPEREPELQSAKDGSLFNMLWKSTHCSKLKNEYQENFWIIFLNSYLSHPFIALGRHGDSRFLKKSTCNWQKMDPFFRCLHTDQK